MLASPRPPTPKIATLSVFLTFKSFLTTPNPVNKQQPSKAEILLTAIFFDIFVNLFSETTEYSENEVTLPELIEFFHRYKRKVLHFLYHLVSNVGLHNRLFLNFLLWVQFLLLQLNLHGPKDVGDSYLYL